MAAKSESEGGTRGGSYPNPTWNSSSFHRHHQPLSQHNTGPSNPSPTFSISCVLLFGYTCLGRQLPPSSRSSRSDIHLDKLDKLDNLDFTAIDLGEHGYCQFRCMPLVSLAPRRGVMHHKTQARRVSFAKQPTTFWPFTSGCYPRFRNGPPRCRTRIDQSYAGERVITVAKLVLIPPICT